MRNGRAKISTCSGAAAPGAGGKTPGRGPCQDFNLCAPPGTLRRGAAETRSGGGARVKGLLGRRVRPTPGVAAPLALPFFGGKTVTDREREALDTLVEAWRLEASGFAEWPGFGPAERACHRHAADLERTLAGLSGDESWRTGSRADVAPTQCPAWHPILPIGGAKFCILPLGHAGEHQGA